MMIAVMIEMLRSLVLTGVQAATLVVIVVLVMTMVVHLLTSKQMTSPMLCHLNLCLVRRIGK